MGRRQQLAGGLAAQDVAAPRSVGQAVGRIGLAALELLGPQRRDEAFDLSRHEALERPFVETVLLLHLHGADIFRPSSRHLRPLNDRSLWPGVCSPVGAHAITTDGSPVAALFSADPPLVWALLPGTGILIGLLAGFLGSAAGSRPSRSSSMSLRWDRRPEHTHARRPCFPIKRAIGAGTLFNPVNSHTARRGVVLRGGVVIACALCRARGGPMVGPRACLAVTQIVRAFASLRSPSAFCCGAELALGQSGGIVFI